MRFDEGHLAKYLAKNSRVAIDKIVLYNADRNLY
jgi:hypothetical protein